MNAFSAIQEALSGFNLPCVPQRYTGKENRYFEYNYATRQGADYGDNRPGCNMAAVQVHLYLPLKENFLPIMNDVQEALFEHDFSWPSVTVMEDYDEIEAEQGGVRQGLDSVRHIVFETDYIEDFDT